MSTNTSQNLGLHLWEPTDQVLRTEFNQNWQKIDTAVSQAYTTQRKPAEFHEVTVSPSQEFGAALLTLDYKPSFAILANEYGIVLVGSGDTGRLNFQFSGDSTYNMSFWLDNKRLVLFTKGSSLTGTYIFSAALFR